MLTKNEISTLSLSPTKKDFVQIWNELLDVAGKLSERWDPTSTNESDPGIVILKALTGIADKLNYNIDKNTLEAFMPTAAQEDSMRKLCDMLGYSIKYYRSAETSVTIKYYNASPEDAELTALEEGLLLPKFTTITNSDQDISYFTTNQTPLYISKASPSIKVNCMEGQIVKCESTATNNVITANQISENNRFYLPEAQIAENGIFVYNAAINEYTLVQEDGAIWERVDNLNIQAHGARVFKFGYDSYEGRPYIEFPADYSELINDGLFIYYTRTSGANGNVSAKTLTQIALPSTWSDVSAESFTIENSFSATSGANIETINQAYNNFKKTIGTFETLVTCRDYMNKIYMMTNEDTGKYLVSNILATDIRTDLNRAVTICSCDDAGIFYKETPLISTVEVSDESTEAVDTEEIIHQTVISEINKPVFNPNRQVNGSNWFLGSADGMPLAKTNFIDRDYLSNFDASIEGRVEASNGFWWVIYGGSAFRFKTILPVDEIGTEITTPKQTITKTVEIKPTIDHFDLVLYPFKSYNQIKGNVRDIQSTYDASFKYDQKSFNEIKEQLDLSNLKTIAHNIKSPNAGDIISINNYLKLNAIIGTHTKITAEEGVLLIEKIKIALANAFNMRELDFGEEIPFDSLMKVIVEADSRINVVSLTEPALYTTFSVFEGNDSSGNAILKEYAVASDWLTETQANATGRFDYTDFENNYTKTFDTKKAKEIYNRLAVRNVLAGRVPLFKYNTTFNHSFSDSAYRVTDVISTNIPEGLEIPHEDLPFTRYVENDITYTGQYIIDPNSGEARIVYTKTYTPAQYAAGIIAKDPNEDSNFTEITANCTIKAGQSGDKANEISDVTLADGEIIKFRAYNFTTAKTYPAYVNYHLKLNKAKEAEARSASAYSLESLLNTTLTGSAFTKDIRRDKVLEYFEDMDCKKTFTLTQKVAKKSVTDDSLQTETVVIDVENPTAAVTETPAQILAKSGFVKLLNKSAILAWDAPNGTTVPSYAPLADPRFSGEITGIPDISLKDAETGENTMFIVSSQTFNNIQSAVDIYLQNLNNQHPEYLPTECDWTISYQFEYVPFEPVTLNVWEMFIKEQKDTSMFGFVPVTEAGTALWRIYSGGSYSQGKYILPDTTQKLMPFMSGHFGLLETNRLTSIYVAEDLGSDVEPNYVNNNEEYELRTNEYLYIEYTPSTTTEDGTTQEQEPVKEILGRGTIIKPSGFESGLIDSTVYAIDHSAPKSVKFDGILEPVPMYSLGASEQIAIRDFAQVKLNRETLPNASEVYVYKNFNNCAALESEPTYVNGKRINNSYTLKDGEYIFYTDQNKAEFAYFTSGTEVTLTGSTVLSKYDIIDLATIFDSGIQEIPWKPLNLLNNEGITFQEYQYITLGSGDTLTGLRLTGEQAFLNDQWQTCDTVTYTVAGSDTENTLPRINVSSTTNNGGNGWEACSLLELSASPSNLQTLRSTDKVETSIILSKPTLTNETTKIEISAGSTESRLSEKQLSFKTNLSCATGSNNAKISELYTNADNLKSFELKIFTDFSPAVVKTVKNELIPYHRENTLVDIVQWPIAKTLSAKSFGELWTRVALSALAAESDIMDYALRLPVNILPNTYGIFSVYLNDTSYSNIEEETVESSTWIELPAGITNKDITVINRPEATLDETGKLVLQSGVNCIRVNKTMDIFIKTSAGYSSTHAIYFDDLRLVDCTPIEYIDSTGQKALKATQGLNLEQIGYLNTSDADTLNMFDARIREKVKVDLANQVIAKLEELSVATDKTFSEQFGELVTYKAKLQNLIDFIKTVKDELGLLLLTESTEGAEDLQYKEDSELATLFAKYETICSYLDQETALLKALTDNANTTDLEQQLVTLLEAFTDAETFQQTLLDTLDALETAASENSSIFDSKVLSKGAILDDFEAAADTSNEHLVNDLKLASIKEINTEYTTQLELLKATLAQVTDSEAKTSLLSILDGINITKHTELVTQIQKVLNTNQTTLEESITTARELAVTPDETGFINYNNLMLKLTEIRDLLSTASIKELLYQLDFVTNSTLLNDTKYLELYKIVDELLKLVDTDNPVAGNYQTLTSAVNTLLTSVKTKISSNKQETTADTQIVSSIDGLFTESSKVYISHLDTLLTDLAEELVSLNDSYTKALAALTNTDSIKVILDDLEYYSDIRDGQVADVAAFSVNFDITNIYKTLPFGVAVLLAVWPSYMKRAFLVGLDQLYKDVRAVIKQPELMDKLTIDKSFKAERPAGALRQLLINAVNLDAFEELFLEAQKQSSNNIQNSGRKAFIEDLGKSINVAPAVQAAMENLKNMNDSGRNAVIYQLITKILEQPSVTEKQQLVRELIEELKVIIDIDTQLKEISAGLLCPSILLFENKALSFDRNDAFYARLTTYISTWNKMLLGLDSSYTQKLGELNAELEQALAILNALISALNKEDIAEFADKWNDIASTDTSNTLLQKDYLDKLGALHNTINTQDILAKLTVCRLIKLLQQDLVVAWQDNDKNWLDSTGNYYQKYINNTWTAYPSQGTQDERRAWIESQGIWSIDGKWRTNTGNYVEVQLKRVYITTSEGTTGLWVVANAPESTTELSNYEIKLTEGENVWIVDSSDTIDLTQVSGQTVDLSKAVHTDLAQLIQTLLKDADELGQFTGISDVYKEAYTTAVLEDCLIEDIRALDPNRAFYWNVPVEANVAIDFNEGDVTLNTLMNPVANYDINNINNNFVISKIDINYLTNGLQIARSSRLG